jgi:hypothetical protein
MLNYTLFTKKINFDMKFLVFLFTIIIVDSCNIKDYVGLFKDAGSEVSFPPGVNSGENRTIVNGNDSVQLDAHVLYNIVRYEELSLGLGTYLVYTVIDSIQSYSLKYELNGVLRDTLIGIKGSDKKLEFADYNNNFKILDENNVEVVLELQNKNISRRIRKGELYKVLYRFVLDVNVYRDNLATCSYSGYEIIDIVPVREKFYRDTSPIYQ